MKNNKIIISFLVAISFFPSCKQNNNSTVEVLDPISNKVDSILSLMSLKEKIGQMTQINLTVIAKGPNKWSSNDTMEIDYEIAKKAIVNYGVGSVLNTVNNLAQTPKTWFENISDIQKFALDSTNIKVPVIYGIDAIHGATYTDGATMFPQQISTAATWNPVHAYNMATVCAYETRACGIPWNFSPVLDLGVDPRFPRQFETFGEDPFLVTEFGKAMIKGYQGEENKVANSKVAACMKHFTGYQATISGKDRTPAYIPDNVLFEYHIKSFKAAIDAGAKTVMINSGLINGIPVHSSYKILTEILRNKLGFQGVILTDWEDINKLCDRDKVAINRKEAIKMAINAGIDMSMVPYEYEEFINLLIELVEEGEVKISRIDDAVSKILRLKLELDLFKNPVTDYRNYGNFASNNSKKLAYQSACESSKFTDKFAEIHNTIFESFSNVYGEDNVTFISGVSYKENASFYDMTKDNIEEVINAAKDHDYILLCLGENSYTEKPGDLHDLNLHKLQLKLANELSKTGKPIILVLNIGRPRLISEIEPLMSAILNIYLPGNFGGDALADIVSGKVNPSGKLPYTYPAFPNSLSTYYYKPSEVQNNSQGAYNYVGKLNNLYEFGYGLSYTKYEYKDFVLENDSLAINDTIKVSVDVYNKGAMSGFETVQLYTTDMYASISPDNKRLRAFEKTFIESGSFKKIKFKIPVKDLSFFNINNESSFENGDFMISIGPNSKELTSIPFNVN